LAAVEKRAEPYLKILLSVNDLVRVNIVDVSPCEVDMIIAAKELAVRREDEH
jgi:hypothetical protein